MKFLIFLNIFFLISCATSLPYTWYGLSLDNYNNGKLLAKKKKDDLHIRICQPGEFGAGKCIVILLDEWNRLMVDYKRTMLYIKQLEKQVEKCE